MPIAIQMPKLGHAMTEGTVLQWHKREGDQVSQGDPVLTVETDKAQVEVEAPASGVLARLSAAEGEIVQVGGTLAIIAQNGESVDVAAVAAPAPAIRANAPATIAPVSSSAAPRGRAIASPRAKRLAGELGVDLAAIAGTGPDGLVTEDDVRKAATAKAAAPQAKESASSADGALSPARREKLTRIQQVGARNLTHSWQNV